MRFRTAMMIGCCLSFTVPASAADFDWEVRANRELIDKSMRRFSTECAHFGFTALTPPDPDTMQKRIYSMLLLKPDYEALSTVSRWAGIVGTLGTLDAESPSGKATSDKASKALTAAALDPTTTEVARKQYIAALLEGISPFFNACKAATSDSFIGANYITGTGTLDDMTHTAEAGWTRSLAEVTKPSTDAHPIARKGRR